MDKFSLNRNDYQSNLAKSFQSLRHKEDFCDVTLVGEDYKQVTAHKVILSSCSEYFDNVFSNFKKHSHPLLCLEGLKYQDIQNTMDYIYNGELKICQEDIDRFLEIAQRLKLEGLNSQESTSNDSISEENNLESFIDSFMEHPPEYYTDKINEKTLDKKERKLVLPSNDGFNTLEKLDQRVLESFSREKNGHFSCNYCSKICKSQGNIKEHVEVHFDGLVLKCDHCERTCKSRKALRSHISRNHKEENKIFILNNLGYNISTK